MSKMNTKRYLEALDDDDDMYEMDYDEETEDEIEYFEESEEDYKGRKVRDLDVIDKRKDHKEDNENEESEEEEEDDDDDEDKDDDEPSEIRLLNLCQKGKLRKVKKLIEDSNVDVNIRDKRNHRTPLIIACESGRRQIVKLLLNDERVDVNLADDLGQTPLFHACMNRKVEIVKLLLENEKVDINIRRKKDDRTPFIQACLYNYGDIVKLLLESGRNINVNEKYKRTTMFRYACILKAPSVFGLLKEFKNGKLPNIEKSEKVKRKREEKEEEEYREDFRLHTACKDGNFIIVQEYLQNLQKVQESFPNSKSDKILNSKDLQGRTPFYCACENQRTEVVRLLLENENVDPNIPRKDGWTPLIHASARGYFDIVELMLLSGREIDVNAQDSTGNRAIGLANLLGANNIVDLLKPFSKSKKELKLEKIEREEKEKLKMVPETSKKQNQSKLSSNVAKETEEIVKGKRDLQEEQKDEKKGEDKKKEEDEKNQRLQEAKKLEILKQEIEEDRRKLEEDRKTFENKKKSDEEKWNYSLEKIVEENRKLEDERQKLENKKKVDEENWNFSLKKIEEEKTKFEKEKRDFEKQRKIEEEKIKAGKKLIEEEWNRLKEEKKNFEEKQRLFEENQKRQEKEAKEQLKKLEETKKIVKPMEIEEIEKEFVDGCAKGNVNVVKKLLQNKKLNVNVYCDNCPPLIWACGNGHLEVVKLLLDDQRVDINLRDKAHNLTGFCYACLHGKTDIVKLMLNDERLDVNKQNNEGWTGFLGACSLSHLKVIQYILATKEVDLELTTADGCKAIDWARQKQSKDVIELLESYQTNPNETRNRLRNLLGLPINFQTKIVEEERQKKSEEKQRNKLETQRKQEKMKLEATLKAKLITLQIRSNNLKMKEMELNQPIELNNWKGIVIASQLLTEDYRIDLDIDEIPVKVENQVNKVMEEFTKSNHCSKSLQYSNCTFRVETKIKTQAIILFNQLVELIQSN